MKRGDSLLDCALPSASTLLLIALFTVVQGCRIGGERQDDGLRDRVVELERELESARKREAETQAQLQEAVAQANIDPDVVAATPHVVDLSVGGFSQARDEDGDGRIDTLRIYVHPVDSYNRFTQLVGSLSIHAAILPPDAEAQSIARINLSPQEVREAYRSSLMGTHYVFSVPVNLGAAEIRQAEVRVMYEDGRSGRTLSAHRTVSLQQSR
jgi:hypothetical protein